MRWVALALILLSLPAFVAMLGQSRARRDMALLGLGLLTFVTGRLQIDAALVTWPLWAGTVRGIVVSPVDTLALALIVTRNGPLSRLPFLGLVALYSTPILLSLAVASVPMATTFSLAQLLRMTLFFVAVAGELERPTALRSVLIGISLGLMLQAGYVVHQKLSGVVQATGTLVHQNVLGLMVELAALPLIAAVLEGEKSKLVYAGLVSSLIIVAGGGSRGTMAFFALAVLVLVILSLGRRITQRKLKIVGLGIIAAAVFVPLAMATLHDRFGSESLITEEEQRKAFERAAHAIAADHPIGVGANLFVAVNNLEGYADRAGLAWNHANRAAPVHNAYLLARAETGWPGQIMLVLLFGVPAIAGARLAFRHRKLPIYGIALGSASALVGIAIHNNYEYAWYVEQPQRLFFLNLAVIAGCLRFAQLAQAERRRAAAKQEAPSGGAGLDVGPGKGRALPAK